MHSRSRRTVLLLPGAALALGCAAGAPAPPTPSTLAAVPGPPLAGRVGDSLAVTVRVLATDGRPVAGQGVLFVPAPGAGTVAPPSATTDAAGEARTIWQLGGGPAPSC